MKTSSIFYALTLMSLFFTSLGSCLDPNEYTSVPKNAKENHRDINYVKCPMVFYTAKQILNLTNKACKTLHSKNPFRWRHRPASFIAPRKGMFEILVEYRIVMIGHNSLKIIALDDLWFEDSAIMTQDCQIAGVVHSQKPSKYLTPDELRQKPYITNCIVRIKASGRASGVNKGEL